MSFVIRSMSTTDYVAAGYGRPEQKPVPYHVYLVPVANRAGAWWRNWIGDAQKFDTMEEAQAEIDRAFAGRNWYELPQAVAMDDKTTFWDFQKERSASKLAEIEAAREFAGYSRAK